MPPAPTAKPFVQNLSIVFALLLACVLRWHAPERIPYTYDDAGQIAIAGSIGGNPFNQTSSYPLLSGGTTLGVQRSALHAYLLAGFLALGGAIESAVWGIAALGVLATALVYRLGGRIGGHFVGLWSALFMAVNPWLIYHDRRLWAHISTLLSVLLLYLAWRIIVDRRTRRAVFVLPLLAIQTLSHTLGIVQALSLLGAIAAAPRAWLNRSMAAGIVLAVVLAIPYSWALFQTQAGGELGIFSGAPADPQQTVLAPRLANLTRTNHWTLLNHLATGSGFSSTVNREETAHPWWHASRQFGVPFMWLILGVGVARLVIELQQPLRASGARLLLLWGFLPLLVLGIQPVRIAFQYWTVLLPLPALFAGLGLDWLRHGLARIGTGRKTPQWRAAVARVCNALPVLLAGGVLVIWMGSYLAVEQVRAAGGADIPLNFWRAGIAVAEEAARQADIEEIRFAVSGLDPAFDGQAAAVATLIGNPPYARFVAPGNPPAFLLHDTRPSLYYWTIDAPQAQANLELWGERIWTGSPSRGEPPAHLYRLPPYPDLPMAASHLESPVTFDVGLQLLGYHFPDAPISGEPAVYTLIWRVLDPPWDVRTRDFTAYNHILLDLSGDSTLESPILDSPAGDSPADAPPAEQTIGDRIGQIDGLGLLSRDWWPGDVLVQSYELSLPAGRLIWRTGLYSRTDYGRAYTADWQDAFDIPFQVQTGE